MDFISKYWAQVRAHLGGLSASQRIAIGLCVTLVLVGVVALVQWSARGERVPLLPQAMSTDEQARTITELQNSGADFIMVGDKIMVHEADRRKLLASLHQAHALPANTSMGFMAIMQDNNPFLARDDARWKKERALEVELSDVLSQFDGLADARVFINTPQRRMIGGTAGKASASVHVRARGNGGLDKQQVLSIASFVAAAVEGLTPDAVSIVDSASNRHYSVPKAEDGMAFDVLDLRREREEHYASKIAGHLSYIPGVLVDVNAEVNLDRKQVSETKRSGKPVMSTDESTKSETSRGGGAVGPGVQPNVSRAVAGGGANESTSKEESKTSYDGLTDQMVTQTVTTPGDIRKLTASINVPRSYFAGIFKQRSGAKEEAKDSDLEPIIKSEVTKIRTQVRPLIAATDDNQIEVDWFYDTVASIVEPGRVPGSGPAKAAMASGDYVAMAKQYGPQAGLGLLALFSLFSVTRMLKKAQAVITPPETKAEAAARLKKAAPKKEDELGVLPGGETLAGEALSTQAVLEGREVGEDEVRIRHIIGQLGQMVKEDSGTAVGLVEQWVVGHR